VSKLDGNERWQSKMLLPEHQEQYDSRHEKPSGHPSPDELTMVRDYVLLPYMMKMVQKCMDELQHSSHLLKRLYLGATQVLMNKINKDMYELRRELSRRKIKILDEEMGDLVVYHHFVCRGYQERLGIVREVMRAEISMRMAKYIGDILRPMKE